MSGVSVLGPASQIMRRLLYAHVLLCCFRVARSFCPSQCTCVYHGRSDGTGTRSVLCNDYDMSEIPVNVPTDTVKLRVEKTAVRRIPTEAFYYLVDLRYLWITYNSITSVDAGSFYNLKVLHELRLDGNMISVFPWEALKEMPSLRTLDLHNNRLTSIPLEAATYLANITYLDISSNKLTTLPADIMDIWPPFSGVPATSDESQKVVLGLQDNPWFCDCKISKLIELSKMTETPVVLMDQFIVCSGPENFAGVLFQRAELDQCLKPTVMISATKITSPPGSNVLLRCDATGYPTPTLMWSRPDGSPANNTVVQESPGEGIRWSIISLHGIHFKDAGRYRCKAKNVAGNSEASITLAIEGMDTTTVTSSNRAAGQAPIYNSPLTTALALTSSIPISITTITTAGPPPPVPTKTKPLSLSTLQTSPSGGEKPARMGESNDEGGNPPQEEDKTKPGNLEVLEVTSTSALLAWTSEGLQRGTRISVVYSLYGEDRKQSVDTDMRSGKLLLEDLRPNQRYTACLVTKGYSARKVPCVELSTPDAGEANYQSQVLMIASGIACAVALPLIVVLLYKIASLYCKKQGPLGEKDLSEETYVKFETLSLRQRTMNTQPPDMWARRQTQESERMLLCSRSSIDSQMTYKSDSSRSEYLC